jgi:hypothetical protein
MHERRDVGVPQTEYSKIEVPKLTIDEYCTDCGIENVDLLKMDIEGHELQALKGAQNIISNQNVRVVTFEFGSANVNSRTYFRDFWEFFNDFGYQLRRMMPGGGSLAVKKYTEELEYFRGATNYIAKLSS